MLQIQGFVQGNTRRVLNRTKLHRLKETTCVLSMHKFLLRHNFTGKLVHRRTCVATLGMNSSLGLVRASIDLLDPISFIRGMYKMNIIHMVHRRLAKIVALRVGLVAVIQAEYRLPAARRSVPQLEKINLLVLHARRMPLTSQRRVSLSLCGS